MKDTFNVIYNPQVYNDINSILNFYDFETKNNLIGKKFLEALKINLKNYSKTQRNIRFVTRTSGLFKLNHFLI
ncbi:hypothetical protein P872_16210 [Rhodonellum psychrophilum GCM71 = DSM 17998]|uniref:Plasmid stabilization protein n=2 Tax=Rhodonellum TaxID=336827 RepID=U5C5D3_9BACT|nr:hypothetical protein P872_16210 [Rhodonellum psychrophilum GCM71 = DSM 17998]SDZ38096.1 hypothetical protein SAMN05444412_11219 [Rhodonellum ikkaensis]